MSTCLVTPSHMQFGTIQTSGPGLRPPSDVCDIGKLDRRRRPSSISAYQKLRLSSCTARSWSE
ncbi:hypothetical protein ACQY0O_004034 [Thecaphora frezii]